MSSYLVHWGTKRHSGRYPWGSGDRPYQSLESSRKKYKNLGYDDDTLHTYSKRTSKDMSDQELQNYLKRKNLEKQYNKLNKDPQLEKLERSRSVLNESSNLVNKSSRLIDDDEPYGKNWERMDLTDMSDQELRDRINRENLEIQYSKLFNSKEPEVKKGKETVQKTLDVVGDVLAFTNTAVGLAIAIKMLKGK